MARAVKTRGLRGELVAHLLTDFPARFDGLAQLIAVLPSTERLVLRLEGHWFQGGCIVLKFAGYDSVEAARSLVGCELTVPEAECVELAEDEFYDWQLTECRVETIDGTEVGRVREILHTGGSAPVLVIDGTGDDARGAREHLIPLAADICVEIDTTRKLIRVDAPEGLLEL